MAPMPGEWAAPRQCLPTGTGFSVLNLPFVPFPPILFNRMFFLDSVIVLIGKRHKRWNAGFQTVFPGTPKWAPRVPVGADSHLHLDSMAL